jgi:hypothetical protein
VRPHGLRLERAGVLRYSARKSVRALTPACADKMVPSGTEPETGEFPGMR